MYKGRKIWTHEIKEEEKDTGVTIYLRRPQVGT